MAETPIEFQIFIENSNREMLDDGAVDDSLESPVAAFVRRSETQGAAGTEREGLAALEKVGAASKWRAPEGDANPWLITHERVISQPIEAGPFDALLEKRARMKPIEGLTYRKRVDENGVTWNEGFAADGTLKSAMVVISDSDE